MKLFRKLAIACLTLFTVAGMATACSLDGFGAISVQPYSSSEETISSSEQESTAPESSSASSPDKEEEDDKEEDNLSFVYRIKVQNATGFGFRNVTVRLKDGDEVMA